MTRRPAITETLSILGLAIALAALFWTPLFLGAGFIGGDTYNYFFPLKQFYQQGLMEGEIRLWHPGIGNGVPVLAESQTGVFYPFHLITYRLFELNAAYNVEFLLHYVLAFLFSVWLARDLGLSRCSALLAGVVFVFGWFPPRACLEWAIITGAWLPLELLALRRWLRDRRIRWGMALSLTLGIQLLAGHFQLAFVSTLALAIWALTSFERRQGAWVTVGRRASGALFVFAGFGLAAIQLVPTWELRERSQRALGDFASTIDHGNIPFPYLLQTIAPFWIYPARDAWLSQIGATNAIEAHWSIGMVSCLLILVTALSGRFARRDAPVFALVIVGLTLAVWGPGPWLGRWPGFGFFRYPGRYGLMAQLGAALLTGIALDRLFGRNSLVASDHANLNERGARSPKRRGIGAGRLKVGSVCLILTTAEFYWTSRVVQYVSMTRPPALARMSGSEVFQRLSPTDRVMAMDGNTLALSGASCVPPYLGMGPAEYYAIWSAMPDVFHGGALPTPKALRTLFEMGVTHVLTEAPLSAEWPVTQIWKGYDPFLHPRWGRDPRQPLYLYRLNSTLGRASMVDAKGQPIDAEVTVVEYSPHEVVIEVTTPTPGRFVLTDLLYPPYWLVEVDGAPAPTKVLNDPRSRVGGGIEAGPSARMFRDVELSAGAHRVRWRFDWARHLRLGAWVSAGAALALVVVSLLTARPSRVAATRNASDS